MRRLKSRCCETLRNTSVLLRGLKTGCWGVDQIREPKQPRGATHENRNGSVDSDFDVRVWFCAQQVGYATPPSTPTGGLTRRAFPFLIITCGPPSTPPDGPLRSEPPANAGTARPSPCGRVRE